MIETLPVEGKIYTVRDRAFLPNSSYDDKYGCWLEEIVNPHVQHPTVNGTFEPSFAERRFRKTRSSELSESLIFEKEKLLIEELETMAL